MSKGSEINLINTDFGYKSFVINPLDLAYCYLEARKDATFNSALERAKEEYARRQTILDEII